MLRWCVQGGLAAAVVVCGLRLDAEEPWIVDSVVLTTLDEVEVPAEEAGVFRELLVSEGSEVCKGDLLGRLDDAPVQLKLERAEIELENARRQAKNDIEIRVMRKAVEVARAELQRALDSRERYAKSVSDTEVDHLRLRVDHAELQLEQAEYDRETAQYALSAAENGVRDAELQVRRRMLHAPLSGRVVQVLRHEGEWVQPGQPVVRIIGTQRLKAIGSLDGGRVQDDITGRPVVFEAQDDRAQPTRFSGVVAFVHPEVNPVNQQIDFWAEIENPQGRLRPGWKGRLTILAADP